ncbi:MAG: hypothetical protein V4805_06935 [Pseudomonadota bacterium]
MHNQFLKISAFFIVLSASALFANPSYASGGDGFSQNAFAPEFYVMPHDLPAYAAGNLGIVPGSYWRVYHYLAYRALNGQALSKPELDLLKVRDWRVGADGSNWDYANNEPANGVRDWLSARKAIQGAPDVKVTVDSTVQNGDYTSFINCPADALQRAALTLAERLKNSDQHWTGVWLANQDTVFANCSLDSGVAMEQRKYIPVLPAALPPKAPAWLKHDHEYQTAAALFYAGKFDAARARFQAISANADSPWQPLGAYLAARCLIRQATLHSPPPEAGKPADPNPAKALLMQARSELLTQVKSFPPAQKLVDWIDARVQPMQRLNDLSLLLSKGKLNQQSPRLLSDYLLVLDKVEFAAMLNAPDSMTAWIGAMQLGTRDEASLDSDKEMRALRKSAMSMARRHWKDTGASLWLLPLLSNAKPGELSDDELKAAAAVPADAPGAQTVQYYLARLAIARGQADQADAIVSAQLQKPAASMSHATRNRWLAIKLVSATTMEGFLQAGLRTPADNAPGVPITDEAATAVAQPSPSHDYYDMDFERHLFRDLSQTQLTLAYQRVPPAQKALFPIPLWTRAVVFGDYAGADALTDELMAGRDTTRHLYQRFKDAKTPAAKRQAAMLIMVNAPELHPNIIDPAGGVRFWGCHVFDWLNNRPVDALDAAVPNFLDATARADAEKEQTQLLALPIRSSYLGPLLLEWAKQNPHDPEVPKALHFFIASTRMECSAVRPGDAEGKANISYSQQAFQLLKSRYPKSEWAAKTKYYF